MTQINKLWLMKVRNDQPTNLRKENLPVNQDFQRIGEYVVSQSNNER